MDRRRFSVSLLLGGLTLDPTRLAPPPSVRTDSARITVTIRRRSALALNSAFTGLSYEKVILSTPLFSASNGSLVALFRLLGPGVLRIGGNTVDVNTWDQNGSGGQYDSTFTGTPKSVVAPPDVDRLAGFLRTTGWKAIYGINLATNTQAAAAAEAAYAERALGSALCGFEIGNEPDMYSRNHARHASYAFSDFLAEWKSYAAAIRARAPHIKLTGPATSWDYSHFTCPFASANTGISLLTQHVYAGNDKITIDELLQSPTSPRLRAELDAIVAAGAANGLSGVRITECGSGWGWGSRGASDVFAAALWAADYLFTLALSGVTGVNLHVPAGGNGALPSLAPGTPIADDGRGHIVDVRPLFYGMLLFSQAVGGAMLSTSVHGGGVCFSGYATAPATGGTNIVLINKDPAKAVSALVQLGSPAAQATILHLTAPSLNSVTDIQFGGASIHCSGAWLPAPATPLMIGGSSFTISVPPASALLARCY